MKLEDLKLNQKLDEMEDLTLNLRLDEILRSKTESNER